MNEKITFTVHGINMLKKRVSSVAGHSSVLYLPKSFLNKTVVIIELEDLPDDVENIELPDLSQQARKITHKKQKDDDISDEDLDREFLEITQGGSDSKRLRRI